MSSRRLVVLLVCIVIPTASPSKTESPTLDIRIDQVGYPTGLQKTALVVHAGAIVPTNFEVRGVENERVVLTGKLSAPVFDEDSGDTTQTADFTSMDAPGSYYLQIAGVGKSAPFRIASDVYTDAYKLTARSFYGQRCGTAVDLGHGFHHEACHTRGSYDPSSGKTGLHLSTKGWHDAGDYGRYIVNSSITTATLLWASELWGQGRMGRVNLEIPESGSRTPDILSEARWNIEWMLTMQDSDGGVWHKQTSAHFCGFVPPDQDNLLSLVIGSGSAPYKTSCATGGFAAVTASASILYKSYDPVFAERCLTAAKNAWNWLSSHPSVTFKNPPGITTGEYGDEHCADEQLWAAVELARATRDESFDAYFTAHYREFLDLISADEPPSWSNTAGFALWRYALGKGRNVAAVQEIEARSTAVANVIAQRIQRHGYRNTLIRKNYVWGSNGVAANYSLQLLVANRLAPKRQYREAAAANMHYLFGCNAFSLSFVTGMGSNSVRNTHHRPSAELKEPWPGLLSGGPNSDTQDPVMKRMIPADTPPAKAFLDLQASYASNEVAINWNAPLVFALAGLLSQ